MLYLLLNLVAATWVFLDARGRRDKAIAFGLGTLLLGPLVAPVYLARRPLREGETREGGTGWRVCANLVLAWTITMMVAGMVAMTGVAKVAEGATSDAAKVGTVIGAGLGLMVLFAAWILPVILVLVIGLVLRKSGVVEKGPTGALASVSPAPAIPWFTNGWIWSAIFVVVAFAGNVKPKAGPVATSTPPVRPGVSAVLNPPVVPPRVVQEAPPSQRAPDSPVVAVPPQPRVHEEAPTVVAAAEVQPPASAASPADVYMAVVDAAQKKVDEALLAAQASEKVLMDKLDALGLDSGDMATAGAVLGYLRGNEGANPTDAMPKFSVLRVYAVDFVPVRDAYRRYHAELRTGREAVAVADQQRLKDDPEYRAQVEAVAKAAQEKAAAELAAQQAREQEKQDRLTREGVARATRTRLEQERVAKIYAAQAEKENRELEGKRMWAGTDVTAEDAATSPFFEYIQSLFAARKSGGDEDSLRKRYDGRRTPITLALAYGTRNDGALGVFQLKDYIDRNESYEPDRGPRVQFQYFGTDSLSDAAILRSERPVTHTLGSITLDVAAVQLSGSLFFNKLQNNNVLKAEVAAKQVAAARPQRSSCVYRLTAIMRFDQEGRLHLRDATLSEPVMIYAVPEMTLLNPTDVAPATGPTEAAPVP